MILNLPDELIIKITNNLDYYDLKEFLQVNKHLNDLLKEFFNKKYRRHQGINNRLRKHHNIKQPGFDVQRKNM